MSAFPKPDECRMCGGNPASSVLNDRGDPCPCRCHEGARPAVRDDGWCPTCLRKVPTRGATK